MLNIEQLLSKVTSFIHEEANTTTVVGQEFTLGDYQCVPVIRVGIGFGSGGGEGKDAKKGAGEGGGAGAALGIEPLGFLVAKADDIKFVPTSDKKGFSELLGKMPDVLNKYFDMKKGEKTEKAS
jgi:uncharacterized spore protein YtfJ